MSFDNPIQITECPRDAMQGWPDYIPVDTKVKYLNELLKVGFETLDFGSFVSPKAIPQMRDTEEVLQRLELSGTKTKLLSIIANKRGAETACQFGQIHFLGFPFSVSEEFQKRNANSTISEALERVGEIQSLCVRNNKELVIYISMGFGNPYGEPWNSGIVINYVKQLIELGISNIALADTIGVSNPENIRHLFSNLIPEFPKVSFGAHLHSHPDSWREKIIACYESKVFRFDAALKGIGGCPMAKNELVGNLATENIVDYFGGPAALNLNESSYMRALKMAGEIFH